MIREVRIQVTNNVLRAADPRFLRQIETTHILVCESSSYGFILLGIPPRLQKGKSDLDVHILIGHWLVLDHTEQGERVNLI